MTRCFLSLALIPLMGIIMLSCKKDRPAPEPQSSEPVVRPVGNATGEALTFTVGAAGGEFSSADQSLHLSIPSGAVSGSTTLTIQAVENTCTAGMGTSFSLLPHGTQFSKPVTLTYSYANLEEEINIPEALGIAYQDAGGIWRFVSHATINKTDKTVSIQTTHFSNWTLLQWLKLEPVAPTIGPNESLNLQVMNYLPASQMNSDDILAPLPTADRSDPGIGGGTPLPPSYIRRWQLGGVGELSPLGASAVYKAPASVSAPTTAGVSAEIVSTQHQLMVVSNIKVIPDGLSFRIDGGSWKFVPGVGVLGDDQFTISSGAPVDGYVINISWNGTAGTKSWDSQAYDHPRTLCGIINNNNNTIYQSYYDKPLPEGPGYNDSHGYLKVSEMGGKGQYVNGSFSVTQSGLYSMSTGEMSGIHRLEGSFHVKRVY